MSPYNSFVYGPQFTKFFSANLEGDVVDKILIRICDTLIRSGDIRDQS